MKYLVTSDLHLTDRPRDAYRFGVFDWLVKQQKKHNPNATLILGDLTDRKDNHSSNLVNKIVDSLTELRPPVYILCGNHDYIDPKNPFFGFLNCIDGIKFVIQARALQAAAWMIPHCQTQEQFNVASSLMSTATEIVFCHNTFTGAVAEAGATLTGLRAPLVNPERPLRWYSGDIHRPQALKCGLTYVGAPYHVRFGDDYEPRVLLVGNTEVDLHFPCLKKWTLRFKGTQWRGATGPRKGDHVKVIVTLSPEEVVEWAAVKRRILDTCREMEVQVFGVELEIEGSDQSRLARNHTTLGSLHNRSPKDTFRDFCSHEKLAENIKQVGEEFVSD